MNNGQVALAFTSGYLFGRNHRTRWALALAGAAAGRRLMSGHSPLDTKKLMSSEVGKLTEDLRSQLMSAGKSAAVAAASQRMEALSDRLEERTSTLRSHGAGEKAEKSKGQGTDQAEKSGPEQVAKSGVEQVKKTVRGQAEKARPAEQARSEKSSVGSKPRKAADRPPRPTKKAATEDAQQRSQG
ncbi:hypothetical protein ABT009_04095 [Streptomyces sp. NPDC002896]|uniref:hypothetical protein n=1 Tax=Streptomyces sp. NPDC002896 TaxID=3154438 RepID=UPI0033223AEF